jgi:hypothetical protein
MPVLAEDVLWKDITKGTVTQMKVSAIMSYLGTVIDLGVGCSVT